MLERIIAFLNYEIVAFFTICLQKKSFFVNNNLVCLPTYILCVITQRVKGKNFTQQFSRSGRNFGNVS